MVDLLPNRFVDVGCTRLVPFPVYKICFLHVKDVFLYDRRRKITRQTNAVQGNTTMVFSTITGVAVIITNSYTTMTIRPKRNPTHQHTQRR